jgi:lipoic acid synthetase
MNRTLQVRWLGKVPYREAMALQTGIFENSGEDHALLLEHSHVFTMGVRTKPEHVLFDANAIGADIVPVNRGGDVTYHGPGQLVGYFIQNVGGRGGLTDTAKYVCALEQVIIDSLDQLGLVGAYRERSMPGVWVNDRKIAAIGVRITRGRTMHGFALNVDADLSWFDKIIPCGLADKKATSLKAEGLAVTMRQVVDAVSRRLEIAAANRLSTRDAPTFHAECAENRSVRVESQNGTQRAAWKVETDFGTWTEVERYDSAWKVKTTDLSAFTRGEGPGQLTPTRSDLPRETTGIPRDSRGKSEKSEPKIEPAPPKRQPVRMLGRLAEAGVSPENAIADNARKPDWMKVKADFGPEYSRLKKTVKQLDLVTVCEEAGCPNIFDCWNDGTATFMINGERCTRACGFCLVDTRKPEALDPEEPMRVAEAVAKMQLQHAVITVVARDDLKDGGASAVAATVRAIHERCAGTAVETLISDCKGDAESLQIIFDSRPEVLNHNLETVVRLQRAVRPSAGYARSLSVLARAKQAGLTTKSGLIAGMGETFDEMVGAMTDLRSVGVDILTIGQYLRPTTNHLPMSRWVAPEEFQQWKVIGEAMGFAHVESSPLTRSSYHAKQGAQAAVATSIPVQAQFA